MILMKFFFSCTVPVRQISGCIDLILCASPCCIKTGCCQFFIVHEPQPHLDGVHTVFGQVTDNLQAVRQMRNGDVMKSVTIDEA